MIKSALLATACMVCLQGFSNSSKDSVSFYLKQAQEFKDSRKIWDADKCFQKALQFDASDEQVRIAYGNYLVDQHKFFPAVEQYGKVLEKNINHPVAIQKMTDLSFTLRRWNDVIMYGTKLSTVNNASKVNYMMGKAHYENENYGQAEKFLAQEVSLNPKASEAVSLLGKVYIELSNYKQAIAVYNQALNLDPNNNQMIYELGLLYYTMNNEKEAVRYFELAIQKGYKKDLDMLENMGLAYLGFDLAKGVETLNQVLAMKPGNSEILFQVAQAYYKAEKFQDASDAYKKIYDADPSNVRAFYMSGVALIKKGDKNKGAMICDQAIRMDPSLAQLKSAKSIF